MGSSTFARLSWYRDRALQGSAEDFADLFPCPVLIAMVGAADHSGDGITHTATGLGGSAPLPPRERLDPNARVYRVEKTPGANHYANMIVVGRAPNSDICVQGPAVSKLQGYFSWEQVGAEKVFQYTDGGSRNGSSLNDRMLRPHAPHQVRDGDLLTLGGSLTLLYTLPKPFHALLLGLQIDGA